MPAQPYLFSTRQKSAASQGNPAGCLERRNAQLRILVRLRIFCNDSEQGTICNVSCG